MQQLPAVRAWRDTGNSLWARQLGHGEGLVQPNYRPVHHNPSDNQAWFWTRFVSCQKARHVVALLHSTHTSICACDQMIVALWPQAQLLEAERPVPSASRGLVITGIIDHGHMEEVGTSNT